MLRGIFVGLLVIFLGLEYRFWFGTDSVLKVAQLKQNLVKQEQDLQNLQLRNQALITQIANMKTHPVVIEEQARYELGMVKQGEKYYQVVEPIE